MSTLKTNNLQLLDSSRNIAVSKIAEMNGGFSFRNKIVDGRFDFWYEGTSQTTSGYGSDTMYYNQAVGSTHVHSQQLLTVGIDLPAIEVPSAKYFSRTVVTSVAGSGNATLKLTNLEWVGTLAGKIVTLSFYAKANAVKNIAIELVQFFGVGGSTLVSSIGSQLVSLSTTWKRYSVNISIPSISGKTVGTSGDGLCVRWWFDAGSGSSTSAANLGQQSGIFDIACVQLEEGSVMTPFEELPMEISQMRVNRYYQKIGGSQYGIILQTTATAASQTLSLMIQLQTEMRVNPVKIKYGNWATWNFSLGNPQGNDTKSFFLNGASVAAGGCSFNTVGSTTYVQLDARL